MSWSPQELFNAPTAWISNRCLIQRARLTEHLGGDAVEDIFNAVMEARREDEAFQMDDMDVEVLEPLPTRREILDAVSVIERYIDDMNDPIARKLDSVLVSFRRELRIKESKSLISTKMTDYFRRK